MTDLDQYRSALVDLRRIQPEFQARVDRIQKDKNDKIAEIDTTVQQARVQHSQAKEAVRVRHQEHIEQAGVLGVVPDTTVEAEAAELNFEEVDSTIGALHQALDYLRRAEDTTSLKRPDVIMTAVLGLGGLAWLLAAAVGGAPNGWVRLLAFALCLYLGSGKGLFLYKRAQGAYPAIFGTPGDGAGAFTKPRLPLGVLFAVLAVLMCAFGLSSMQIFDNFIPMVFLGGLSFGAVKIVQLAVLRINPFFQRAAGVGLVAAGLYGFVMYALGFLVYGVFNFSSNHLSYSSAGRGLYYSGAFYALCVTLAAWPRRTVDLEGGV